jgi:hypothetical protein
MVIPELVKNQDYGKGMNPKRQGTALNRGGKGSAVH